MSRLILIVVVFVALLAGGMALLASKDSAKPLAHVEKVVPVANLAQ